MTTVRVKAVVTNPIRKADGSPLPFLGLEDLESRTGRLLAAELPVKQAEDSVLHTAGDVLFSKLRPYLAKSYLPAAAGSATGELLVLRPGPEVDRRFLFYVTLSRPWVEWANTTAYGTKMPRTSWDLVGEYRMWLPPPGEQRRIADFLDAETGRIDTLLRLRARMRGLLALKRDRVIGRELGTEEAAGASRMIPLKYLTELITVGIVITPAKYYVDHGGVPALRGLNVRPGRIDAADLVRISTEGALANQKSRLRTDDVVVVRTGQAGAAAVVPSDLDGANCIDLILVRPGRKLSPRYVEYVLNSAYARERITEHAVGSIQAHFNVGAMKQIPFPALARADQDRVAARLDERIGSLDALTARLATQERLLTERRQALITAAVTGQLDVATARGVS